VCAQDHADHDQDDHEHRDDAVDPPRQPALEQRGAMFSASEVAQFFAESRSHGLPVEARGARGVAAPGQRRRGC